MNELVCNLPRNLNKPDTIQVGIFELSWKQIGYLSIGAISTYYSFISGFPIIVKISFSALGFIVGACLSFIKYQGHYLDEICLNGLIYFQRQFYYKNLSKEDKLNVTIQARKEESTIPTKPQTLSV